MDIFSWSKSNPWFRFSVSCLGIWESDWQNWRMHEECHESATLNDEMQDGFYPFENERPKPIKVTSKDRLEPMETV